jgi:hypothetical protein
MADWIGLTEIPCPKFETYRLIRSFSQTVVEFKSPALSPGNPVPGIEPIPKRLR